MEFNAENPDLPQQMLEALQPLLNLVRSARTISPGKVGILNTLSAEGRASTARMSQAIGVSQQAISLAAKELEGLGLVERQRDDADRRKVWFRITAAGQHKLDGELQLGYSALKQALGSGLSAADLALIAAAIPALKKINPASAQ